MSPQSPNAIVLIHGLWMTPLSWENWIERYQKAGYEVIAPAWPGMEGGIDALRADPTAIEHLGFEEIIDHYDTIIAKLPSPPIIMGHSFGGAFAEVLLDRGLGRGRGRDRRRRRQGNHQTPVRAAEVRFPGSEEPGQ